MLENKLRHSAWFKESNITVKEFLDYVLLHCGDFYIKIKLKADSNKLLLDPVIFYYLTDNRYSYKLNNAECEYLSENNEYFKNKLGGFKHAC